jgi:K(+)-stimulated pyrophosphate-energized sodium pump
MEGTGKPEYDKCVAISTKASIKEMVLPGVLAIVVPVAIGFIGGAEMLGGLLAGVTTCGVLMAIFQSNAGGAWDNAKKMIEEQGKKGTDAHKAAVVGDTVGDPFKDTSGPSLNILLKLMSVVALVIAPSIAMDQDEISSYLKSKSDIDNIEIIINQSKQHKKESLEVTNPSVTGQDIYDDILVEAKRDVLTKKTGIKKQ